MLHFHTQIHHPIGIQAFNLRGDQRYCQEKN